jgi:hypothetical protein
MGLTGSVPDALAFLRYLDTAMAEAALTALLKLGQTETGSRALGETFLDLFLLSLQAVADDLADTATSGQEGMPGIVVDLVDQNWGPDEPAPRVRCTDVGESYQVTADAIARLCEYGAIVPDRELDAHLRKMWRLPARDETAANPAVTALPPPGGYGPAPGSPAPPPAGPGGGGSAGGHPASKTGRRHRQWGARAAAAGLRRDLTLAEAASGFDPLAHQAEWASHLALLVGRYRQVVTAQKLAVTDAVRAAVKARRADKLGRLEVPDAGGTAMIEAAMMTAAEDAAARMCAEAASQGVHISLDTVSIDSARLAKVAAARAELARNHLATAAGTKALQVTRAAKSLTDQADDAASEVEVFLDGLSDVSLYDQLGSALTAAQNTGRLSVLEAAPESAGEATYIATEILDVNTCGPCEDIDGTEFASLADAEAAYPNGGYLECDGGMRCRGTAVATWGGG